MDQRVIRIRKFYASWSSWPGRRSSCCCGSESAVRAPLTSVPWELSTYEERGTDTTLRAVGLLAISKLLNWTNSNACWYTSVEHFLTDDNTAFIIIHSAYCLSSTESVTFVSDMSRPVVSLLITGPLRGGGSFFSDCGPFSGFEN